MGYFSFMDGIFGFARGHLRSLSIAREVNMIYTSYYITSEMFECWNS